MIRLSITPAAYALIVAALPENVGFEQNVAPESEFFVWFDAKYVDRLRAMRQLGESYSDVIVRLAEAFLYNDAIIGIRGDTDRLREVEAVLLGLSP